MTPSVATNLQCVLYHSVAVKQFNANSDLAVLADFAERANQAAEISGALFYTNGIFVQ